MSPRDPIGPPFIPQLDETRLEHAPGAHQALEEPLLLRGAIAVVAVLGEEGHEDVGEERADVETHGAVKRKLVVDDKGGGFGAHDAARVEVAVQQRGGVARELGLEGADGGLELAVRAKCRRGVVELGGGPVVVLRLGVGLGENHLLRERAHVLVLPERLARLAQRLAAHGDGRAAEQRGGEVFADVRREIRVDVTGDDPREG